MGYEKGGKQKDSYSSEEVIGRNCPLCKSASYIEIYKERGAIGIVKCKNCSLIYTNPMAKEAEKNYWGDEKRYYEEARLIFDYGFSHHRDSNYLEDLKLIEDLRGKNSYMLASIRQ